MSARDRILQRLHAASVGAPDGEDREKAVSARLSKGTPALVPEQAMRQGAERVELFCNMAVAADAKVTRVKTLAELPTAISDTLRKANLPAELRCGSDPLFDGIDWGATDISKGVGRVDEPVTLSRAEFGLAETGTLVLMSGPENPVTLTFLGETHFVVLHERDVLSGLEGLWEKYRASGADPRTVNLVTGPSRSADIGQSLQLGAHGPVDLQIFLIA